ncbi:LysM peptidoglycan-binding domain-containing protein [Kitasatospora arboriphila]
MAVLQMLYCLSWLLWLWLALHILHEAVRQAAQLGPLIRSGHTAGFTVRRTLAGILVAAVVLAVAAAVRPADGNSVRSQPAGAPVAAAAALAVPGGAPNVQATVLRQEEDGADWCTVLAGDTLWDLAERHLGDPLRWHEIYELNAHRPQDDGQELTDPDLIYTGWTLHLPTRLAAVPAQPRQPQASAAPSFPPPDTASGPAPGTPGAGSPAAEAPPVSVPRDQAGIELPDSGGYIALCVAAAVSAAAAALVLRRRRGYRPEDLLAGSTGTETRDPEQQPLVQAIRRTSRPHLPVQSGPGEASAVLIASSGTRQVSLTGLLAGSPVPALTLTGPGAAATACALVAGFLTGQASGRLITSHGTLRELGISDPHSTGALLVAEDPEAALAAAEAQLDEDSDGVVLLLGAAMAPVPGSPNCSTRQPGPHRPFWSLRRMSPCSLRMQGDRCTRSQPTVPLSVWTAPRSACSTCP